LKLQKDLDGIKSVIEPFRPGHHASLSFNDDGVATIKKMTPYTSLTKIPEFDCSVKVKSDIKENIRALFTEAVRKRLMSDRRIGCLLSGGLDSSLVTAVLVKLARESGISYPIQTFSVGMTGSTDLAAARKVADFLSTEHHELVFTPEEGLAAIPDVIEYLESYDITTVRASVGMYLISKYIREKTDTVVIFSGEGSDELAQGYIYFHKAPSAEEADVESKRLLEDLYLYDVLRGDRSTAAHGLEIRVPFLDVAFTSYFLSLTPSIRQPHEKVEKYLLRSAFDEEGLLPNEILWRPKEAFSDGVSSTKAGESWYEIIQKHCKRIVSDIKLETAAERYPFSTPKTKEAYYYRKIFENKYPGQSHLIPYMWLPKWSDSQDPSARTLAHYTQE
jgi:asparagine synthase (glutamine-hydrolysing)